MEASQKSGSLITANFALNQNREVLAVPGSPLDPRCSGSNSLIQNGARLVQSSEDVIDAIRFNKPRFDQQILFETQDEYRDISLSQSQIKIAKNQILELIDSAPIDIDQIIGALNFKTEIILVALLELEFEQKVHRHPENKISLNLSKLCCL